MSHIINANILEILRKQKSNIEQQLENQVAKNLFKKNSNLSELINICEKYLYNKEFCRKS